MGASDTFHTMATTHLEVDHALKSEHKGLFPLVQVFCKQDVQAPHSFVSRHARQVKLPVQVILNPSPMD